MSAIEHYDVPVLGSGEAGKYIAWTRAKAGSRAAVVERGLIGGSCPNIACLPSKNVIYSARVATLSRRGAEFGITSQGPGLAESGPMTHVEALDLDHVPEHLIVLGGGYVGLEFAQPMRRFGARVTVVERGPQIAAREDPDVAEVLTQQLADEGIDVVLDARALEFAGRSGANLGRWEWEGRRRRRSPGRRASGSQSR